MGVLRAALLTSIGTLAVIGTALLSGAPDQGQNLREILRGRHMAQATTEAAAKIAEFEKTKDVESLRAAMNSLSRVDLGAEQDAARRLATRKDVLQVWLAFFAEIDKNLDPKFDPNEQHYVKLTPPPADGIELPSGASPDMIKDPKKRKEYEDAIKENDRKTEAYNLQTRLRRLDAEAVINFERFLRGAYSSAWWIPAMRSKIRVTRASISVWPTGTSRSTPRLTAC
jgi:hypothetical protein